MRILFLVHTVDWLETGGGPYHGAGWTGALIRSVADGGHQAAVVYQTSRKEGFVTEKDGIRFYALPSDKPVFLGKFGYYYGGWRHDDGSHLLPGLNAAVEDFWPDLIHLFGFENPMAVLLGETTVPVAVHVQGLLGPVSEAFCPPGITRASFLRRFPFREIVLRNGNLFAMKSLAVRAVRERERMARAEWVLGRTDFDRAFLREHAPQARYFTVNEILREPFYVHSAAAQYADSPVLRVVSTLSDTMYKGFDLVLRTAKELQTAGMPFSWTVIGMGEDSPVRHFFEKECGIRSEAIRFAGDLTAEEMVPLLLGADVYVHPSYVDNSPNSLCEAQLLGLPCVACAVGGVPSLIEDNRTGLLTPAGDAPALAGKLMQLRDRAARERIGRAAYAAAKVRHDKESVLRALLEAYDTILK